MGGYDGLYQPKWLAVLFIKCQNHRVLGQYQHLFHNWADMFKASYPPITELHD